MLEIGGILEGFGTCHLSERKARAHPQDLRAARARLINQSEMSIGSGEKIVIPGVGICQTTECLYRLSVSAGLKLGNCPKVPEPCRREWIAPQIGIEAAYGLVSFAAK